MSNDVLQDLIGSTGNAKPGHGQEGVLPERVVGGDGGIAAGCVATGSVVASVTGAEPRK